MNLILQQRKLNIKSNLPDFIKLEFNKILSREGTDEKGIDYRIWEYNNFEVPVLKVAIAKRKLSSLKDKFTKMSSEEIDKQLKSLRDEWERDF